MSTDQDMQAMNEKYLNNAANMIAYVQRSIEAVYFPDNMEIDAKALRTELCKIEAACHELRRVLEYL